ncbi:unnamed protein product, partial [Meganyctiphanes norvegica]
TITIFQNQELKVWMGTLVHATDEDPLLVMSDMLIGLQGNKIIFVEEKHKLKQLQNEYGFTENDIYKMSSSEFLMPGLVDTHIHAAQFPNNGLGMDLTLMEWLPTYIFPQEAMFQDTRFAQDVYTRCVNRLLRNGTTCASYYGSVHLEASKILADSVMVAGQRALVGKVNMMRRCPVECREGSVQQSLEDTQDFILYVKALESPLVSPCVSPRSAPFCSEEQLSALGHLASVHECHVQTHLAETLDGCDLVASLFPHTTNYTHVYNQAQLL